MATPNERRTMTRLSMIAGSAATLAAAWIGVIRVDGATAHQPSDPGLDASLNAALATQTAAPVAPSATSTTTATPATTTPAAPSATPARATAPAPTSTLVPAPTATATVAPATPTVVPTTAPTPSATPRTVITRRSRAS